MENKEKIIKAKLHIPSEQYGYIEVELEGTIEEISVKYFTIKNEIQKVKKDVSPF